MTGEATPTPVNQYCLCLQIKDSSNKIFGYKHAHIKFFGKVEAFLAFSIFATQEFEVKFYDTLENLPWHADSIFFSFKHFLKG